MSILKSEQSQTPESADSGRRSFFWKLGAGVSAALASTAGIARAGNAGADELAARVAALEDEKALRELHRAYERALDTADYDDVVAMFADAGEAVFGGKLFSDREGLSRLYRETFASGRTGKRMEPAPGFELASELQQEHVEVSPGRLSAKAEFPFSIQVGQPIESDSSLASMARLQGEGVRTWWEGGVYAVSYIRNSADSRWQIARLEYRTLSRADYRPGRSYARPLAG